MPMDKNIKVGAEEIRRYLATTLFCFEVVRGARWQRRENKSQI